MRHLGGDETNVVLLVLDEHHPHGAVPFAIDVIVAPVVPRGPEEPPQMVARRVVWGVADAVVVGGLEDKAGRCDVFDYVEATRDDSVLVPRLEHDGF